MSLRFSSDVSFCPHILKKPDDPSPLLDEREDGGFSEVVRTLSLESCIQIKQIEGFSFRECWEGDPLCAAILPSHARGMALMGAGLYCTEHRLVVIPLHHPTYAEAKTLVMVQDFDLPPCLSETHEGN